MMFTSIYMLCLIFLSAQYVSSYSSNNFDEIITEMKIKAITSFELRSMTFDESPNLFFLYENFTRCRFDSIHKHDADRDQNFTEFRKIHQYQALLSTFTVYSSFIDVILNKQIKIKKLGIFKTNWTWTNDQILSYGFMTENKLGNLEFKDETFVYFFLAQYFLDNIFKPVDHPSDDEMELRIRFLLYMTTHPYDERPLNNEFIMTMIEDVKTPIINNQIRNLMLYRFNNLLDSYLPNDLKYVDKVSKMFAKDEAVLKNLWDVDENNPYFLRFFRFLSSGEHLYELRDIGLKYFKVNGVGNGTIDAPYLFKGKNQLLNILYWIYQRGDQNFTKNFLDVTNTYPKDGNIQKLSQKINFLDFVDDESFSRDEKREFYLANGYDLISNLRNGPTIMDMWRRLQRLFTSDELKHFLTEKDLHFNHTHLFLLPSHENITYVQTFIDLTRRYLNREEIKELLMQRAPVTGSSFIMSYIIISHDKDIWRTCWNFAKEYLSNYELKNLILNNEDPGNIDYNLRKFLTDDELAYVTGENQGRKGNVGIKQ